MNELVSIVCTTLNEEKLIAKTLESFLNQELNGMQCEILVVDGMSTDGTRDIIKAYCKRFPEITLIDNAERKNPYGRNKGVNHARGNYIALLGAHTIYDSDYVKVCIDEMKRTNSIGVSGKVVTAFENNSSQTQLCELILNSKFGVSGESFRTVNEGYSSMINFPVFKREVFDKVGLYDVTLHRNQDNDFNSRIISNGFKLYNTWKTSCKYYPADSLNGTFAYAYKNGFWNAKSIQENPGILMTHHYVPFVFVLTLFILLAVSLIALFFNNFLPVQLLISVAVLHLIVGFSFSIRIKKYRSLKNILALPFLFFAFHFSYGWGTLRGFFTKQI